MKSGGERVWVWVWVGGWRVGNIWKGECEEVCLGSAGVCFFFSSPVTQLFGV